MHNIKNNFVNEINGKLNNDNDNYNYNNKIMENQKKIDNSNYFENNYNEKHILIKVDSDQSSLSTHSNNTNIFDIYNYSDVISNNNNKSNDKSKISKALPIYGVLTASASSSEVNNTSSKHHMCGYGVVITTVHKDAPAKWNNSNEIPVAYIEFDRFHDAKNGTMNILWNNNGFLRLE